MTEGVMYYNKGTKCLVRLILCINSLRRHYKGPITVFIEGPQPPKILKDLKDKFGVNFIEDSNPKSATLVRKIEISRKSPYDYTLFIDADMLILGDISEFFKEAKSHDLVASHFTDWRSDGGTITKRIKRFKEYKPDYMDAAIAYGPAINTGIYAFPKNSPIWDEWLDTAKWGSAKGIYIPDEVACQVIAPKYNVKVLPSIYNVSVVYVEHIKDKRVIHFHGRKHCKEFPLCELWIKEFRDACKNNLCHIRDYVGGESAEKRLSRFLKGAYGWKNYVKEIKDILNNILSSKGTLDPMPLVQEIVSIGGKKIEKEVIKPVIQSQPAIIAQQPKLSRREWRRQQRENKKGKSDNVNLPQQTTVVTSVDKKYVDFLRATLPNWVKYKNIDAYPMIVYVNGFSGENDPELAFIKNLCKNARIISWDMPNATSQRERMLSSFVLGTSKDVTTKFWLKLDADAFFTDRRPLLEEDMFDYVICGHKWHYTKPGIWIKELDDWAKGVKLLKDGPSLFDPKNMGEKRYIHERTASYVQLHQTEFTKLAANLCEGGRMPVPSHDTFLWFVAAKLKLPIKRHNFKRFRGVTNVPRIEKLKMKLLEVENLKI